MQRAKVRDCADQEHPRVQSQGLACQRLASTRQRREAFPKCRVEPLNVRGVDHPIALRAAAERLNACRRVIGESDVVEPL